MAAHRLADLTVSVDEARTFVSSCSCGWRSDPCQNGVHAVALHEDHASEEARRERRRPRGLRSA
jgi:hypothetical protein